MTDIFSHLAFSGLVTLLLARNMSSQLAEELSWFGVFGFQLLRYLYVYLVYLSIYIIYRKYICQYPKYTNRYTKYIWKIRRFYTSLPITAQRVRLSSGQISYSGVYQPIRVMPRFSPARAN